MGYWLQWNWYASSRSEVTTHGLAHFNIVCVRGRHVRHYSLRNQSNLAAGRYSLSALQNARFFVRGKEVALRNASQREVYKASKTDDEHY